MSERQPIKFQGLFYDINDVELFKSGFNNIKNAISSDYVKETLSVSDNLLTWGRTYSFIRDSELIDVATNEKFNSVTKSRLWRIHIALRLLKSLKEISYLEIGTGLGEVSQILVEKSKKTERDKYILWDQSFSINEQNVRQLVENRFRFQPYVSILSSSDSSIPNLFEDKSYNFLHLVSVDFANINDLLSAIKIFERPTIILIDWYGWSAYLEQKEIFDNWCCQANYPKPMELPTGQGLMLLL